MIRADLPTSRWRSVRTDQTMYNMLTEYAGKIDVNFDKMLWRYTGVMPKDPFSHGGVSRHQGLRLGDTVQPRE